MSGREVFGAALGGLLLCLLLYGLATRQASAQFTRSVPQVSNLRQFSQFQCRRVDAEGVAPDDQSSQGTITPTHLGFLCKNGFPSGHNTEAAHGNVSTTPQDWANQCPVPLGWEMTVKWMSFRITRAMETSGEEQCKIGLKQGGEETDPLVLGLEAWSSMGLGVDVAETCDTHSDDDADGFIDDVGDWCINEDPVGSAMAAGEQWMYQIESVSADSCDHVSGGIVCIREDWKYVGY